MKILIVDDHQLFLEGMELIFKNQGFDVFVVKTISQAKSLLAQEINFDLALVDLDLAGSSGLQLLQYIKAKALLIPFVVMSANEKASLIAECIDSGASGYIPKSSSSELVVAAINDVLAGSTYIPRQFKKVVNTYREKLKQLSELYGVGSRQLQVLQCLDKGFSNKEIGEELHISEATVKSHVTTLFKALEAKNRVECLKSAKGLELI